MDRGRLISLPFDTAKNTWSNGDFCLYRGATFQLLRRSNNTQFAACGVSVVLAGRSTKKLEVGAMSLPHKLKIALL